MPTRSDTDPITEPSNVERPRRRLPRYRRTETVPAITIGRPKHQLMTLLGRFGYLSADQLAALAYRPTVITFVRDHLKELFHARYVRRTQLLSERPYGSPRTIHLLDTPGGRYTGTRPPDPVVGRFFLEHTLAAAQLIVLARLLAFHDPTCELVEYRTERELKPIQRSGAIPDGWIHLRRHWPGRDHPNQHYIAWELDRGTVQQRDFRKKLRALVAWIEHHYADEFGVTGLTVAFVMAAGPARRLGQMVRWAEEELGRPSFDQYAQLFLFAAFDPFEADPERAFLEPIWRVPFSDGLHPLLEPPARSSPAAR